MLPDFIGIGAPKAATTWISRCLSEHPEIFVAEIKETDYFSWRYKSTDISFYESHFENGLGKNAVGEISTSYLSSKEAPGRAYRTVPEAKIFVSLRNPVDQVYSHFWHLHRQDFHSGEHSPDSFEEAIDVYPDKLLRPAKYYKNLSRWLKYYKRNQLHIIIYENISVNPLSTIQDLFCFLDVDNTVVPSIIEKKGRSVRKGSSPKGENWEKAYRAVYDFLVEKVYGPMRKSIGDSTADKVKNLLKVREIMEAVFREKGYPDMKKSTRHRLKNYFREDIESLESLIDHDLSSWK